MKGVGAVGGMTPSRPARGYGSSPIGVWSSAPEALQVVHALFRPNIMARNCDCIDIKNAYSKSI